MGPAAGGPGEGYSQQRSTFGGGLHMRLCRVCGLKQAGAAEIKVADVPTARTQAISSN